MTPRDQFIGVYVSADLKRDLVAEAKAQNVSLSLLVNRYLFTGLGQNPVLETRARTLSGRPAAKRVRIHIDFKIALMACQSADKLAKKVGIRPWTMECLLRGNKFALTDATLAKLHELATLIGYKGLLAQ